MRVLVSLAVLSVAATAPIALAQEAGPSRKSGWWEMSTQMSAPVAMTQKANVCVDATEDAKGGALTGPQNPRMPAECTQGPVGRNAQGWTFSNTCRMQGMTIQTSGVASGDFVGAYRVEATTRMSPAPMPQMAESRMVIVGKFMGPCPANRKPGQVW